MKKIFLILLILSAWNLYSQDSKLPVLSEHYKISLVTQDPGIEVFIAFGHSAVRIQDFDQNWDLTFNYGSFSFQDPLFIARFAQGDLHYFLDVYPFQDYLNWDIKTENRQWVEQILNLNHAQAEKLFQFLVWNAQEENKYYRYDFIQDNCSTRIRDALEKTLGNQIHFTDQPPPNVPDTYRKRIDAYVQDRPLFQFLFYLVLGQASDQKVAPHNEVFLPHDLFENFKTATIEDGGQTKPLVQTLQPVYTPSKPSYFGTPWQNPALLLWPLLIIVLAFSVKTLLVYTHNKALPEQRLYSRILDFVFFFLVGVMGLIVFYLEFFSVHTAVKGNLNLIWLLPTYIVFAFFCLLRTKKFIIRWYFIISGVLAVVPLACWFFWPQQMHPTMIPLMLLIALRAFRIGLTKRKYPNLI